MAADTGWTVLDPEIVIEPESPSPPPPPPPPSPLQPASVAALTAPETAKNFRRELLDTFPV